jgi:ribose transport system permease protein
MIIIGETDLSIGAMMAVISIITFLIMPYVGIWTAILIALIIGILLGMLNGFFVVYLKIFSFILTLGMQFVYKGFAYILTNQQVLQVPVKEFSNIGI